MDLGEETMETGDSAMDTSGTLGNEDVTYPIPTYPFLPPTDFHDWKYVMRRSCQEIVPDLYLGPYACATKNSLTEMQRIGFTHVVCVREIMERQYIRPNHTDHFTYLVVELSDTLYDNIIPHLKAVCAFLDGCLNSGGRALVHGNGGNSRSAALVIGYLMWRYGVDAKQAHFYVQQKRFCICPSEGFLVQLREYEPIYKALQVVPRVLPPLPNMKRSFADIADGEENSTNKFEKVEGHPSAGME